MIILMFIWLKYYYLIHDHLGCKAPQNTDKVEDGAISNNAFTFLPLEDNT